MTIGVKQVFSRLDGVGRLYDLRREVHGSDPGPVVVGRLHDLRGKYTAQTLAFLQHLEARLGEIG